MQDFVLLQLEVRVGARAGLMFFSLCTFRNIHTEMVKLTPDWWLYLLTDTSYVSRLNKNKERYWTASQIV